MTDAPTTRTLADVLRDGYDDTRCKSCGSIVPMAYRGTPNQHAATCPLAIVEQLRPLGLIYRSNHDVTLIRDASFSPLLPEGTVAQAADLIENHWGGTFLAASAHWVVNAGDDLEYEIQSMLDRRRRARHLEAQRARAVADYERRKAAWDAEHRLLLDMEEDLRPEAYTRRMEALVNRMPVKPEGA